jgi:hypothetical protein
MFRIEATKFDSFGEIYFFEAPDGLTKIGFSANVRSRGYQLATNAKGGRIVARVPGGHVEEYVIHRMLAAHVSHGEWFRSSEALEALISGCQRRGLLPAPVQALADQLRAGARLMLEASASL